jgi:hypothetical protein
MTLGNLALIKELHAERPDRREFEGLVKAAAERLHDAENEWLSFLSRFDLANNAAHALALAALRAAGYRSYKRQLVFQCLVHTTKLDRVKIRLFSICYERLNQAELEGRLEIDEILLEELIATTKELLEFVKNIADDTRPRERVAGRRNKVTLKPYPNSSTATR